MFSENLKKALKESKISQRELEKRLNIANGSVGKWILERNNPSLEQFIKTCYILNKTPNELLDFS